MLQNYVDAKSKELSLFQLELELVCSCDFSPNQQDTMVVIGKEHIGWWVLYPDSATIQLGHTADYQVSNISNTQHSMGVHRL